MGQNVNTIGLPMRKMRKPWKNTRSSMERKIKKTGNDIDGKRKSVQGVRVKGNLGKEGTGI